MMKEETIVIDETVVKETIVVHETVIKESIVVNKTMPVKETIVVTKSKPTRPGSHRTTRSASHKSSASHDNKTDPKSILFPTRRRFLTDSLLAGPPVVGVHQLVSMVSCVRLLKRPRAT